MKLPITDKFLWAMYNFFEKTGEILEPPELLRIKSLKRCLPGEDDFWKNIERKRAKKQFGQFVNYLKRKGYIKIAALKEKKGVLLTSKGKQRALKVKAHLIEKQKRKDKKWIMVMYDIPETKKRKREALRELLISLGYQKLQNSVWVCPYDVLKETEEAVQVYLLDSYIRIFLIEEVQL